MTILWMPVSLLFTSRAPAHVNCRSSSRWQFEEDVNFRKREHKNLAPDYILGVWAEEKLRRLPPRQLVRQKSGRSNDNGKAGTNILQDECSVHVSTIIGERLELTATIEHYSGRFLLGRYHYTLATFHGSM